MGDLSEPFFFRVIAAHITFLSFGTVQYSYYILICDNHPIAAALPFNESSLLTFSKSYFFTYKHVEHAFFSWLFVHTAALVHFIIYLCLPGRCVLNISLYNHHISLDVRKLNCTNLLSLSNKKSNIAGTTYLLVNL